VVAEGIECHLFPDGQVYELVARPIRERANPSRDRPSVFINGSIEDWLQTGTAIFGRAGAVFAVWIQARLLSHVQPWRALRRPRHNRTHRAISRRCRRRCKPRRMIVLS